MFCNHIHEDVQCGHYNPTPPPFITSAQCRSLPGPCAHCSPSFSMLHAHNGDLPMRRELWCVCMIKASSPRSNTDGRKSKNCAVWCAQRQVVFLKYHNYCFSRTIFDRLTGLLWCLLSWKSKNHNEDLSFKWIWDSGGFYYSSGVITFFFVCFTVKLWKSFNGYKTLPNFPVAWARNPIARVNVS